MNNKLDIFTKSIKATIGLMVFALGVQTVINVNLGAAPWDVLCLGIADKTNTLYGTISIAVSVIIILIDVLILKEKIGLGTILDAIVVGKTVDLLNYLNVNLVFKETMAVRIIVLLIGFLLEALGQFIYMKEGLAFGPRDTLQVGLGKILNKIPVELVNTIMLAVVLALGWFLGGPVGVVSFIAPFGIGFAQLLIFRVFRFDPKSVVNENIIQSIKRFGK